MCSVSCFVFFVCLLLDAFTNQQRKIHQSATKTLDDDTACKTQTSVQEECIGATGAAVGVSPGIDADLGTSTWPAGFLPVLTAR